MPESTTAAGLEYDRNGAGPNRLCFERGCHPSKEVFCEINRCSGIPESLEPNRTDIIVPTGQQPSIFSFHRCTEPQTAGSTTVGGEQSFSIGDHNPLIFIRISDIQTAQSAVSRKTGTGIAQQLNFPGILHLSR